VSASSPTRRMATRRPCARLVENEPLGRTIFVRPIGPGNRFAFSQQHLAALFPPKTPRLREDFEFIKVERRGHLLEVTMNRPEQRNSLHRRRTKSSTKLSAHSSPIPSCGLPSSRVPGPNRSAAAMT